MSMYTEEGTSIMRSKFIVEVSVLSTLWMFRSLLARINNNCAPRIYNIMILHYVRRSTDNLLTYVSNKFQCLQYNKILHTPIVYGTFAIARITAMPM